MQQKGKNKGGFVMNRSYFLILVVILCLLIPSAWPKDQKKGVEISFFVDYVLENPIDSIYFDVETQILTHDQAIKKAKLYKKFMKDRAEMIAKYPKPESIDFLVLEEWKKEIQTASIPLKKMLEEIMSYHGPRAIIRLFKEDCENIKEGTVFQMKFDHNRKNKELINKDQINLLFVEYSSMYRPVVISID